MCIDYQTASISAGQNAISMYLRLVSKHPEGGGKRQKESIVADYTGSHRDLSQVVPGCIVIPREAIDRARARDGIRELSTDELIELYLPGEDQKRVRPLLPALLEEAAVFLVSADDAESTLRAMQELREEFGADVRPLFRMSLFNHFGFLDSTSPDVAVGTAEAEAFEPDPGRRGLPVFVIDSGFVESHAWKGANTFEGRVGPLDPSDIEDPSDGTSHGTFVACVIGAVAVESEVRVLKVAVDSEREGRAGRYDAEELAVAAAILRVADQCGDGKAVLNLSFGAPPVFTTNPSGQVVAHAPRFVQAALRRLAAEKPDMVVVASGGNQSQHAGEEFSIPFPAAFDKVVSVGAADSQGRWVLWDDHGNPVPADALVPGSWEMWLNRLAPGVDLLAPAGEKILRWSGSSFAAAVQSAVLAREGTLVDATYADYPFID